MFRFKILEELMPNNEILDIIKEFNFITKNGKVKHLLNTNLQFIEPTEYLITFPVVLTIFEYKIDELCNKMFYIKEYKQKYNLREIKQILIKLNKF